MAKAGEDEEDDSYVELKWKRKKARARARVREREEEFSNVFLEVMMGENGGILKREKKNLKKGKKEVYYKKSRVQKATLYHSLRFAFVALKEIFSKLIK